MPDWAEHVRPRLSSLRLSPVREAEIVEELSQHLDDCWRELIAGGASPDEATRLALADFREGNLLARYLAPLRQTHPPSPITPGAPKGHLLSDLWQDLRYSARTSLKRPGFSAAAVLTLALGIGSATTIFSAIHNILLDPFPYTDARRVVAIQVHDNASSRSGGRRFYTTSEFLEIESQSHVFDEVIGGNQDPVLYDTGEGVEQLIAGVGTANTFRFLGVPALLGRGITPEDGRPDAQPVFVMSHKLWVQRFGKDPSILGRIFALSGKPMLLVGIMPERFTKNAADVWMVRAMDRASPQANATDWNLQAKLKPGVTLEQARADVEVIVRRLARQYPERYPENFSVQIVSWADDFVGSFRKTLFTIAAAVGLLLLIACGNVANMLLVRATVREKEMAIRSALGASRGRLVGQLLIESLLLAVAGAIVGCLFAYGGIKGIAALIPQGMIPGEAQIRLNLPVLIFSLAVAFLTPVLFGLVPALQTAKKELAEPLRDSGKGVSGGFRRGRLRNALVIFEVAMSIVLLSGAGLLVRSFMALQQVDLGFRAENLLYARVPLPRGQYSTGADKQRFFRNLLQRLQALPGVTAAAQTTTVPPFGGIRSDIDIVGKTHREKWQAIYTLCNEDYFPAMQLRLLRGRTLTEAEVNGSRKVAVVNQSLARKYLGNEDPIGRLVKISGLQKIPESPVKEPVFEIVGVVSDALNQSIRDPTLPEVFIPYAVTGAFDRWIIVRTSGPPTAMIESVRREIWAVDRGIALGFANSLEGLMNRSVYAQPRFGMVMMAVFAGVGLVLVAIGVFSVVAYTVSRQTHEIGIRMALGAGASHVLRMVLRMGAQLLGLGILIGLLASIALARVIEHQIWGISPRDPITFAVVVALVLVGGLAACYLPARRATQVNPIVALRAE